MAARLQRWPVVVSKRRRALSGAGGVGLYGDPARGESWRSRDRASTHTSLEAKLKSLQDMLKGILTVNDRLADEPEDDDEGVDCD